MGEFRSTAAFITFAIAPSLVWASNQTLIRSRIEATPLRARKCRSKVPTNKKAIRTRMWCGKATATARAGAELPTCPAAIGEASCHGTSFGVAGASTGRHDQAVISRGGAYSDQISTVLPISTTCDAGKQK